MRLVLVGMYDTNTVSLAPQILRALAEARVSEHRHEVHVREFSIFADSSERMAAEISALEPDVVCFSCYIWNYQQVLEVASALDCTVVLGGPQVTGIEKELLAQNAAVDIVVTGEGETSFEGLLAYFAGNLPLSEVPGITTRGLHTPPAPPTDLSAIPPIHRTIADTYPDITWLAFETSRGCPMRCGYCTWSQSHRMRYYPLDYVLAELDVVLADTSITEVYFCDSSLLCNKQRALAILDHIVESGTTTSFRYEFSAEQLDDDIIARMVRLPGNEFNFGIQTINPAALSSMERRFDNAVFESRYQAFVAAMPNAKITVDLIYGLPGDDIDGYLRSIDYAMTLPAVSRILTNPLIVLPGSRFFREREQLGIVLAEDGSFLLESNPTFSASQMSDARRYSFYLNLLYLNTAVRDAVLRLAADEGRSPSATMIAFFESLPFPLVPGEYPTTIPSVKSGFDSRNRAMAAALARFSEIVDAFVAFAGGGYEYLRAEYGAAFTDQYRKYLRFAGAEE